MRNLLTGAPAAATTLCLYALLVTACSPADSDTAAVAGAADVPSLESLTHTQKQDLEGAGYSVPFPAADKVITGHSPSSFQPTTSGTG